LHPGAFACIKPAGAPMEELRDKPNLGAVVFAVIFVASLLMLLADHAVAR
jgi:hypothetical protein